MFKGLFVFHVGPQWVAQVGPKPFLRTLAQDGQPTEDLKHWCVEVKWITLIISVQGSLAFGQPILICTSARRYFFVCFLFFMFAVMTVLSHMYVCQNDCFIGRWKNLSRGDLGRISAVHQWRNEKVCQVCVVRKSTWPAFIFEKQNKWRVV